MMVGSLCLGMIAGFLLATTFVTASGGGWWSWLAAYMVCGMLCTLTLAWRQFAFAKMHDADDVGGDAMTHERYSGSRLGVR